MIKHRLTLTIVTEWQIDPDNYPDCTTDEERCALDVSCAEDDPAAFIGEDNITAKCEVIRG